MAKRGEGKAARAKAARSGVEIPRGRPRGRQARKLASSGVGDLEGVLAGIQETMRERDRYKSALEQVKQVLSDAM